MTPSFALLEANGYAFDVDVSGLVELEGDTQFVWDGLVPWQGTYTALLTGETRLGWSSLAVVITRDASCSATDSPTSCDYELFVEGQSIGAVSLPVVRSSLPASTSVSGRFFATVPSTTRCVWTSPPEREGDIVSTYSLNSGANINIELRGEAEEHGASISVVIDVSGTAVSNAPYLGPDVRDGCADEIQSGTFVAARP